MSQTNLTPAALARKIDHTMLVPDAGPRDIDRVCDEAVDYSFLTVCVAPFWLARAAERLAGTSTSPTTVVGFPMGYTTKTAKLQEALGALEAGARELDMVMQIGAFKAGDDAAVQEDMEGVIAAARAFSAPTKVIIETAYLTDDEKRRACELAVSAGAAFVKTSTGFTPAGARAADVALMREVVGDRAGVKAAGGIRTLADALALLDAGADRLGMSGSVAVMHALGS